MKKILLSFLLMFVVALTALADVTYSRDLYEKAVLGDREAMFELNLCYYHGKGVALDYDRANYWLERAAELGHPDAMAALRVLEGNTGLSDTKRRQLAAEEKREREKLEAKNQQIDYTKYNDALVKKAQSGDAKAQNSLGECYDFGNGVSQDYNQAVYWYRKAAEQGYASAQCDLGHCYLDGDGVPQDYSQAVYWWRKSADQGYAAAQYKLGLCYYYGNGVVQDYSQAVYWWRKAAEQGDKDAQKALQRLGYSW